jgi:signal transduction histidine kinase
MGKIKEMNAIESATEPLYLTNEEIREPLQKVIRRFRENYSVGIIRSYMHSYLEVSMNKNGNNSFLDLRFHSDMLRLMEACYLLPVESDAKNESSTADMIEKYLGMMAHEVSSQLSGAQIAVDTIIGDNEMSAFCNRPDIGFYFTSLKAIIGNTSHVLKNMITTVKFNSGELLMDIKKSSFSLELFLDECTIPAHIYSESLNKNLIVQSNILGKSMVTDKVKLSQIIHNLLYNAFAHSVGSSEVVLNCHIEKNIVVFSVTSKAVDLTEADLANLFVEYYQAKSGKAGSGIGLYLSKLYTDLLKGYINVTRKDQLITFSVYIPSLID